MQRSRLPERTTCGSTGVRATGARQRNGEAGAGGGEAHADHTWLVGLHFRNANPDAGADLVLRLALAVRLYEGGPLVNPCVRILTPQVPNCRVSAAVSST